MHTLTHDPSQALMPGLDGRLVEHDFIIPKVIVPEMSEILSILGYDQGTNTAADVIYQTLDGADLGQMWREFRRTLEIRNAQRDRLVNFLTFNVTTPIEVVRYPTSENFEEASEYGEPKGIRLGPGFNMSYDFRWYDLAIRYTWMFIAENTQAQVEALHNEALEADDRLMFQKIFKTVFNPLNLASSIRNIPVPVYKFWNGDGIAPPDYKTNTFAGTHNHYLTSGSAAVNTAAITAIEDHLYHHGYSLVNGYKILLFVNRQEGKVLRGARVTNAWQYDFIPGPAFGGQIFLPAALGIAGPAPVGGAPDGLAQQVIGTYGPFSVIEDEYIPAGYMVALASGGPDLVGNPIGIREHQNPAMQGLQLIGGDSNYPLVDSFYRRGFGTGVRHRGAGVVMQVTTNGTYTVPAAYV
jgi:hypothetical protein